MNWQKPSRQRASRALAAFAKVVAAGRRYR